LAERDGEPEGQAQPPSSPLAIAARSLCSLLWQLVSQLHGNVKVVNFIERLLPSAA